MEEQENKSDEKEVYIVIKNSEDSSVMNLKYLKGIKILSILHLVSGVLVFLMDLVTVFFRSEGHTYEDNNVNTVMGFFASLFIITGVVGFISIRKTTPCKISAFMVLSIFSSIFSGILCLHAVGFFSFSSNAWLHDMLLTLCCFCEFVLGIVSSAFCCHACCGCCGQPGGQESSVLYVANHEQLSDGQPKIVHLNINEIQNKDRLAVFEAADRSKTNHIGEEEETNQTGKYSRFK